MSRTLKENHESLSNRLTSLKDRFDDISTENWSDINDYIDGDNEKLKDVRSELKDILESMETLQDTIIDIRKFIKKNFSEDTE